jgi:hypothetical protein
VFLQVDVIQTCLYGQVEKTKVNKLGHKSLPGMDEVFSYVEGGTNTFMPDTKDVQLPGKIGLKAIGGVMKHLPGFNCYWIIYSKFL